VVEKESSDTKRIYTLENKRVQNYEFEDRKILSNSRTLGLLSSRIKYNTIRFSKFEQEV
jgi:hypothetical protein